MGAQLEQTPGLPEGDASAQGASAFDHARQRAVALIARCQPKAGTWVPFATLFAIATLSFLSLWPAWSQPGWPANHESCVWATRVGVLSAAWHRGELLPLWWREGNLGFGSPMPALYHKLQNMVCALLLELFGDIKWA